MNQNLITWPQVASATLGSEEFSLPKISIILEEESLTFPITIDTLVHLMKLLLGIL